MFEEELVILISTLRKKSYMQSHVQKEYFFSFFNLSLEKNEPQHFKPTFNNKQNISMNSEGNHN